MDRLSASLRKKYSVLKCGQFRTRQSSGDKQCAGYNTNGSSKPGNDRTSNRGAAESVLKVTAEGAAFIPSPGQTTAGATNA